MPVIPMQGKHPGLLELLESPGKVAFIGDVHGCIETLSYMVSLIPERFLVFVGDLIDKGPMPTNVLLMVRELVRRGRALCVMGNHDWKMLRYLWGRKISPTQNLQRSLDDLDRHGPQVTQSVLEFLESLPSCIRSPEWIAVHGGYKVNLKGRDFSEFCMYGETKNGDLDEDGHPRRTYHWRDEYQDPRFLVHGHDAQKGYIFSHANFKGGRVYNVDSGCVNGFALSALMYPEMNVLEVPLLDKVGEFDE